MNNFQNDIKKGASYFLAGLKLLRHPRIVPFVIIPIVVNILIFYFGISYALDAFNDWLSGWLNNIPEFFSFIGSLLRFLFITAAIVLAAFTFTMLANLIGSPFYGLMAEQVCRISNNAIAESDLSFNGILKLTLRTFARETQKILYYLARLLPLLLLWLILSFTPLAGIMPFIWFIFGAKMLAIQYIDYAYDNNGILFSKLKKDLNADKWGSFGFGSATTLASMIPLFNIIAVPASVCGGTLFYIERLSKQP